MFYVYLDMSAWQQFCEAGTAIILILVIGKLRHNLSDLPAATQLIWDANLASKPPVLGKQYSKQ